MNWKEFFKPTKRKTKLFLVVIIVLIISMVFSGRMSCFVDCKPEKQCYSRFYSSCCICGEPNLWDDIKGYTTYYLLMIFFGITNESFSIPLSITNMIIWYIVICIYTHLKERRKKR